MKNLIILIAIAFAMASCGNNKTKEIPAETQENDSIPFFQVVDFLNKQIDDVKTTPYFIYKKSEINGKTDSTAIDNETFIAMAQNFLQPDITRPPLKNKYVENLFYDQTTKTISITYTTPDKTLEVQNANVILDEDGKTVKRIYIRKFLNYADSSVIMQLGWKPNNSYQINKLVQSTDQKDRTYLTTVVWNEKK